MSLDKVLRLAGQTSAPAESDVAAELVLAAREAAAGAAESLAEGDVEQVYAALSGLVSALDGVAMPDVRLSWTERTAAGGFLELAKGKTPAKPYGDVTYADPGYQKDGKKRYPVDTEEHVRAALAYINKGHNKAQYSPADYAKVKARIEAAAKKFNIEVADSDDKKVAATYVALARRGGKSAGPALMPASEALDHGPYRGRHTHAHRVTVSMVSDHMHNGDSIHNSHDVHGLMEHGPMHGRAMTDTDGDGI